MTGPALRPPWSEHPFLREEAPGWSVDGVWDTAEAIALAVRGRRSGRAAVVGLGTPSVLAGLAGLALDHDGGRPRPDVVTLTRGAWELLPERATGGLEAGFEWDWLVTSTAPARASAEPHVARLGVADGPSIDALLDAANPETRWRAGHPGVDWFGWRDEAGRPRAVGGASLRRPGGPVRLAAIATDPAFRGRGLGAAVTAALTRDGLARGAWVSLGVRAGNDVARRLYLRLGFRVVAEMATRHRT